MNSKKLILGFCALAAVTVGAPHVFCEWDALAVWIRGREELSEDADRARTYTEALAATRQRVARETDGLARMGWYEVSCVEDAVLFERKAYSLRELATKRIDDANDRIASIQSDLVNASERAEQLRAELAEALKYKELMLQEGKLDNVLADSYIEEAKKWRDEAREARAQRMNRHVMLNDDERRRRGNTPKDDLVILEGFGDRFKFTESEVIKLEEIRLRDLQEGLIGIALDRRQSNEDAFTAAIKASFQRHPTLPLCGDGSRELQEVYQLKWLGYDYAFHPPQLETLHSSILSDRSDGEVMWGGELERFAYRFLERIKPPSGRHYRIRYA